MLKILKSNLFFFIILMLAVFTIYAKSVNYEFTRLDDYGLTTASSLYISDIKNFPKFFLTDCYHNKKITQYYRPILSLSFAIETILFGINIKAYHTTNIILFVLSLYLMYLFLCKLNLNETILKFVILLFCVHPIFVSSVVWLPARNDTLLAVFMFLFLINYINYIKENKFKYFILSSIFFILALFTKETTIILFPVILLLIYCFNINVTKKQALNCLIVFIPVLIIYFYLRHIAVSSLHINHYINHAYEYFFDIVYGLAIYIKYIFASTNVPIMLYDLKFDILSFIINIVFFVSLIWLCLLKMINKKIIIFSFIFFVLYLLPTFVQEYYTWLPHRLIIPLASIVIVFTEITDKLIIKYNVLRKYFIFSFIILFVVFAFSSYLQADKYKSYEVYWLNAYLNAPTNVATMCALSNIYAEHNGYDKAKDLLLKIIERDESVCYALKLCKVELFITKDLDIAESNFLECLKVARNSFYEADVLVALGDLSCLKNDFNKAIEYAKQALELKPYDKEILIHLAGYYALNKQFSEARHIYDRLLKKEPKNRQYQHLIETLNEDEKNHSDF